LVVKLRWIDDDDDDDDDNVVVDDIIVSQMSRFHDFEDRNW